MIDERFSAAAFARLGPNTPAAEELSRALAGVLAERVRVATEAAVASAVEELRGLGHDLQAWDREYCRDTHRRGHSFYPRDPLPREGWLGLHFDTYAYALYTCVEAEPVVVDATEPARVGDASDTPF